MEYILDLKGFLPLLLPLSIIAALNCEIMDTISKSKNHGSYSGTLWRNIVRLDIMLVCMSQPQLSVISLNNFEHSRFVHMRPFFSLK